MLGQCCPKNTSFFGSILILVEVLQVLLSKVVKFIHIPLPVVCMFQQSGELLQLRPVTCSRLLGINIKGVMCGFLCCRMEGALQLGEQKFSLVRGVELWGGWMRELPWHVWGLVIKLCCEIRQMRLGLTCGLERVRKKNRKVFPCSW